MIRSKKIPPDKMTYKIGKNQKVTVTETKTNIRIKASSFHCKKCPIIKLDKDTYRVRRTGKIEKFNHSEKRTDHLASLARSMQRLRDIINTNVTDIANTTWLTITYKENMQDEKQFYDDFRKFIMRLKYFCKTQNYPAFEYICSIEYQARGAIHGHILLLWSNTAPFIKNDIMADIWGFGFTKTTALRGTIENVGAYLTAYLTDIPLEEAIKVKTDFSKHTIKTVNGKKYVKASRLHLYPPGTKLYRCSRGIKRPKQYKVPYNEILETLDKQNARLVYENALCIYDDANHYSSFYTYVRNMYFDITPSSKQQMEIYKSYRVSKYYRDLYQEMLEQSLIYAQYQDYAVSTIIIPDEDFYPTD